MDADGRPSSVVQPPLVNPDEEVTGGGGIDIKCDDSGGGGASGEGNFCELETVDHPGFLKPPPEDEPPTVDQPPVVNADFFSGRAAIGSVLGVVDVAMGFWTVLIVLTTGVTVLSLTPAALAAFCNSFCSLLRSFSLRFSIASWELAFARSLNCISLNRILWWWAYELQCSSY